MTHPAVLDAVLNTMYEIEEDPYTKKKANNISGKGVKGLVRIGLGLL